MRPYYFSDLLLSLARYILYATLIYHLLCRSKSMVSQMIQKIKMKFLRVNSLTPGRHSWAFVKETIINMTPYAEQSILRWWFSIIFIIQLLLLLWQLAMCATLILKPGKVGDVRHAPIMMCATIVIRRMEELIILTNWPIIRQMIVMHKTKKQGNCELHR